jgi:hypothetical protein
MEFPVNFPAPGKVQSFLQNEAKFFVGAKKRPASRSLRQRVGSGLGDLLVLRR